MVIDIMIKSNDEKKKALPQVDYSELPEEIKNAINKQPYTITKSSKLTWDGRQFLIRIPKEIAEEMKITSEWHARFIYVKSLPEEKNKIPKLEIKLIR
ncbi:MAG: hypothetical protein QXL94_07005 [Candidatus Parvarchaeum sp.]